MTTNSNTKAGADKVFSVNLIDFLSTVGHTSFVRDCYQLENSVELAPMAARRLPRLGLGCYSLGLAGGCADQMGHSPLVYNTTLLYI